MIPHISSTECLQPPRIATPGIALLVVVMVAAVNASRAAEEAQRFYIREYRVDGAKKLKQLEVEEAVYPFMGPGRTPDDVERARQALEKAYHDKGWQAASVGIPQQDPRRGVIRLEVLEGKVGRLRVNGAKWFLPSRIKQELPSVAEGGVPDLNQIGKEMVAANRLADRRITPELRPGAEPGTVDIDLNVEDKMPLHGSLEINNRYSDNTTPLRINAALSYANLFQLGHTLGTNIQVAPENTNDSLVFSGYYLARVSDGVSLMLQGTKQNSDVSTLGGAAVAGRGEIFGLRAMFDLPTTPKFYQTFSLGIDYKNLQENTVIGSSTLAAPIIYYPLGVDYSASWMADKHFTQFNTGLGLQFRGMGSDRADYDNKRYNADGSYLLMHADVAHTHDLTGGAQVFAKVQGQLADQPLVNSEQIAAGGLESVRGYLEATSLGDNGVFGTVELRSPSPIGKPDPAGNAADELRIYAFWDAALVGIYDALPGQKPRSGLTSVGIGSRLRLQNHFHASADLALPLIEQPGTDDGGLRVTFRGWADF